MIFLDKTALSVTVANVKGGSMMRRIVFIVPLVLAVQLGALPAVQYRDDGLTGVPTRVLVVGDSVTVILSLLGIAEALTFNQSQVPQNFLEYEWGIYFDADSNAATGDTVGFDVSIALTHFKSDDSTFWTTMLDGTQWNTWIWKGHVGTLAHAIKVNVDYIANTIVMVGSKSWPELANVDESDRFYCRTLYWAPAGIARDYTEKVSGNNFINDPEGDVPYPFMDIVRGEFNVVVTPVAEGARHDFPPRFNFRVNPEVGLYRSTAIRFELPEFSDVTLKIFNSLGREAATLLNRSLPAGSYKLEWDARNEPGGVYFIRLQANEFAQTKKVTVEK